MKTFMRYVRARYNQHQRDWAYRFYIAECARIMANNTAEAENKMILNIGLHDVLYPKPEDDETGEEMAQKFLNKFRGDNS